VDLDSRRGTVGEISKEAVVTAIHLVRENRPQRNGGASLTSRAELYMYARRRPPLII